MKIRINIEKFLYDKDIVGSPTNIPLLFFLDIIFERYKIKKIILNNVLASFLFNHRTIGFNNTFNKIGTYRGVEVYLDENKNFTSGIEIDNSDYFRHIKLQKLLFKKDIKLLDEIIIKPKDYIFKLF